MPHPNHLAKNALDNMGSVSVEEAVEELAKRRLEREADQSAKLHRRVVRWDAADSFDRQEALGEAREDLTAVLPLLCGGGEKLLLGKELEQLRKMFDRSHVEDADVPANWPTVACENPHHTQRPEQHGGGDDWRCPDCGSTWWAVNGEEMPVGSHIEAFLYRLINGTGKTSLSEGCERGEDLQRAWELSGGAGEAPGRRETVIRLEQDELEALLRPSYENTYSGESADAYLRAKEKLKAAALTQQSSTTGNSLSREPLAELVLDPEKAIEGLSQAEREEYERCRQSIVDARNAAPANEGRNVVSSTRCTCGNWYHDAPCECGLSREPGDREQVGAEDVPPSAEGLIEATVAQCRRIETDARDRSKEGLPNAIAQAQGELNVAQLIGELLGESFSPTQQKEPENSSGVEEGLTAEELDCAATIVSKAAALDARKPGTELREATAAKLKLLAGQPPRSGDYRAVALSLREIEALTSTSAAVVEDRDAFAAFASGRDKLQAALPTQQEEAR